MGVHGLWRLIEPSGKPVPVESLENKILAVDVSIWLHQAIKGFQDAKGAPALNAHLLGIFHRVCKLLYFKIKPVFVFDGGVPVLKRETIAKRNKLKHKNISEADKIQKQLLDTLIKHTAVNKVLGEKVKTEMASVSSSRQERTTDDLFKLPKPEPKDEDVEEEESSESDFGSPTKNWNLHNIDTKSEHFKSLPADVRHEILTELKETRKQSSWGRLHELPTQSDNFSGFQMRRLLKRQEVQLALEEAEKEMGGHSLSLVELEEILKDQGVISKNSIGNRIASDENTRYLYIKDVKQALEKARREEEKKKLKAIKEENEEKDVKEENEEKDVQEEYEKVENKANKADLELEEQIQHAIALSLQDQPSVSGQIEKKKLSEFSFLENFNDEDFESETEDEDITEIAKNTKLSSAQNYMMEYSGLTPNEIAKIIANNEKPKKRKPASILKDDTKQTESVNLQKRLSEKNELEEPQLKKIKLQEESKSSELLSESEHSSDDFEEVENMEVSQEAEGSSKKEISDNSEVIIPKSNFEEMSTRENEPEKKTVSNEEILEKDTSVGIISGSEDSENDFEEVDTIPTVNSEIVTQNMMEIKIETKSYNEEEDLFADIFAVENEKIENAEENILDIKDKKAENKEFKEKETKLVVIENKDIQKELEQKCELLQDLMKKAEEIKIKETDEKLSDVKQKEKPKLTEKDLESLRDDLNKEELELRNEQGLRERLGTNITDQMYQEAQDLLELFGLPYVVAPMEAEAQCAFLETASLTDGTITDDSDIWLFGGKTVYKNFFNQSKHVREYRAEDIKHHFKLTREQMILLALLVGSDYTTGLQGVGPVTAMEILANFPPSSTSSFTLSHNQLLMGLNEFKSWFVGGKSIARGKNSLRNKLKNVTFTEGFPSMQVVQAYLNPTVDQNEEKFSWSKPDIVGLIDFGRTKFGWSKIKTEDILKPVIKRMKEGKYQSTLLNYFKIKHELNAEEAQKLMSERVRSAVKRIGQDPKDMEDSEESEVDTKKVKKSNKKDDGTKVKTERKRKKKKEDVKKLLSDDEFIEMDEIEALLENIEKEGDKTKKGRKKKVEKTYKLLEQGNKDNSPEGKVSTDKNVEHVEETTGNPVEEPISILEKTDMNLLIKVLSHQEASTSENASKIAKVKKIAEKLEKVKNPEMKEEKKLAKKKSTIKESNDDNPEAKGGSKEEDAHNDIETRTSDFIHALSTDIPGTSKGETYHAKLKRIAKKLEGKSTVKREEKKQPKRGRRPKPSTSKTPDNIDAELKLLEETKAFSEKRVEDIKIEAEKMVQQELNKKKLIERKLHRKEIIPQRERDKRNLVNTRLKAIEVFRKSKIDPSSKKGGVHKVRCPKEDAQLSESSSDSDL